MIIMMGRLIWKIVVVQGEERLVVVGEMAVEEEEEGRVQWIVSVRRALMLLIPIASIIDLPTKIVGVRVNVKEWKIKMMIMLVGVRRVPLANMAGVPRQVG
jgi:hypothetical protein